MMQAGLWKMPKEMLDAVAEFASDVAASRFPTKDQSFD